MASEATGPQGDRSPLVPVAPSYFSVGVEVLIDPIYAASGAAGCHPDAFSAKLIAAIDGAAVVREQVLTV